MKIVNIRVAVQNDDAKSFCTEMYEMFNNQELPKDAFFVHADIQELTKEDLFILEEKTEGEIEKFFEYVIFNRDNQLYWSNETGWGSLKGATTFSAQEKKIFNLPIDGSWRDKVSAQDYEKS
jgi:hypothetical protein